MRIEIIGLDTSHCIKFIRIINKPDASEEFTNFDVVVAYPKGSLDIKSSTGRIPEYTREIRKMGIDEVVHSEKALLEQVDGVLLETNDGHRHLK